MKLTPWFPNSIKPVREGVYQIRGASFYEPNYRRWNGNGWSETYETPSGSVQSDMRLSYKHGQDMTGWRGIEK